MESRVWTGKPDEELLIPEEYKGIYHHHIDILSTKKNMEFYCGSYEVEGPFATFHDVFMDTSDKSTRGKLILKRVEYYDKVVLANTGFLVRPMVISDSGEAQTPGDYRPSP